MKEIEVPEGTDPSSFVSLTNLIRTANAHAEESGRLAGTIGFARVMSLARATPDITRTLTPKDGAPQIKPVVETAFLKYMKRVAHGLPMSTYMEITWTNTKVKLGNRSTLNF